MRPTAGRLAAACGAAMVLAILVGVHERAANYYYDVTQDYRYDFTRARASPVAAHLTGGSLRVPATAGAHDVVLLAVRVRSSLLGRWFEPQVQIAAPGRTLTQAVERGASGLRYVNLSPLDLSHDTSIRVGGKYLDIDDQDVVIDDLRSDVDLEHGTILVISPHPDDAEIAAYALYAGRNAYIVTVTAGESGDLGLFSRFDGADAYLEKGRIRVWESLTVPMLGAVPPERTANLGYFDGTLETMKADPGAAVRSQKSGASSLDVFRRTQSTDLILTRPSRDASWNHLVEDMQYLVQHVKPDIIVAPYPRLDLHSDHRMSTVALIEALTSMHWMQGSLLLYTNHLPSSPVYPYGDAGTLVSLPPIGGVLFDGLVSNSLASDDQHRKYLALDAMSDLRPDRPDSLSGQARLWFDTLGVAVTGGDTSYFRRAVRANEFFFEVRVRSLYEPGVIERIEAAASAR